MSFLSSDCRMPADCCQDAWDGYRANRNRVLDHLYQNKISNAVILSGDSHANWVSDLARTFSLTCLIRATHLLFTDINDTKK